MERKVSVISPTCKMSTMSRKVENGNVTAADMETSKKLLEEVSRKMDMCLSNLRALLKGSRQVNAVIHQFRGLLKFRKFCFQGNHDTSLICTFLGTLQGEGRGRGLG